MKLKKEEKNTPKMQPGKEMLTEWEKKDSGKKSVPALKDKRD